MPLRPRQLNGTLLQLNAAADDPWADESHYAQSITNNGVTVSGGAYVFDGANSYATVTATAELNQTGDLSGSLWYKRTGAVVSQARLIGKGVDQWTLYLTTSTIIYVKTSTGNKTVTQASLPLDTWVHLAFVYNSTAATLELFADGVSVGSTAATGTRLDDGNDVGVGAYPADGTLDFEGEMDDVRILNRVLTAAEVKTIYLQGRAARPFGLLAGEVLALEASRYSGSGDLIDESYSGNHGTLQADAAVSGSSINLDGTGDYISFTSMARTDFSLSCFATFTALGGSLVSDATPTDSIEIVNSTTIRAKVSSVNYDWTVSALSTATEYHIAVTRSGSTLTLYIDGATQGTKTAGTAVDFDRIGVGVNGSLKDVRIFSRALTDAEVAYLAQSAEKQTPNSLNPVGYWSPSAQSPATVGKTSTSLIDLAPWTSNNGVLTSMDPATDWIDDTTSSGTLSLELDKTNDHIILAALSAGPLYDIGTGDFTVSVWATNTATTSWRELIANWTGSAGMMIGRDNGGGLHAYVASSDANIAAIGYTMTTDGSWHLYTLTRTSGTCQMYVDGSAQGSTFARAGSLASAKPTVIGKRADAASEYWGGRVDDVQIYDRALTAAEITTLASRRNPFVEGGLLRIGMAGGMQQLTGGIYG